MQCFVDLLICKKIDVEDEIFKVMFDLNEAQKLVDQYCKQIEKNMAYLFEAAVNAKAIGMQMYSLRQMKSYELLQKRQTGLLNIKDRYISLRHDLSKAAEQQEMVDTLIKVRNALRSVKIENAESLLNFTLCSDLVIEETWSYAEPIEESWSYANTPINVPVCPTLETLHFPKIPTTMLEKKIASTV